MSASLSSNKANGNEIPIELPLFSKTQSPKSYLFTQIVQSHLGEQASLIISVLISYGRLTILKIREHTHLPIFNIKQSLVSLIQLNLVVFSVDDRDRVFYTFNGNGIYKIIYSGEIITTIHNFYKNKNEKEFIDEIKVNIFTEIVQNVLSSGYLSIDDYLNSLSEHEHKNEEQIKFCFNQLINDGWLKPIDKFHFQNRFDLYEKLYKQQLYKFNKENKIVMSESKKQIEVKKLTAEKFQQLFIDESDKKINSKNSLTFNLNRFLKRQRSLQLSLLCKHKLGPLSAKIYSIILQKFEKNSTDIINEKIDILKYSNEVSSSSTGLDPESLENVIHKLKLKDLEILKFNVNEILREIQKNNEKNKIKLTKSIINPNKKRKNGINNQENNIPRKKIKLETLDSLDELVNQQEQKKVENSMDVDFEMDGYNGNQNENENENENELAILNTHLKILSSNKDYKFLIENSPGSFSIPFIDLATPLSQNIYNQLIKLIFGQDSLRLLNCVNESKLIDEKLLGNLILMKDLKIRSILNRLIQFQILEIQEIPKTQDRSAIRTVFTFKHNFTLSKNILKNCLNYNMAHILHLITDKKSENKILIDKSLRDDVKGREEEMLIESELVKLNELYNFEISNLVKFNRLRSLVDVFEYLQTP
ncbi:hypothetical protein PACTADRAFT_52097 [Pachysolen tannophilus NRRL Y-2460]|uniref:DNA-directed RNA polymerase III subunit RPC3 n=1 Tax=Pachysolen tannophilus NRRL Y-2460 TaxID=669874 RepID=A0A1E4TP34_PACTA|nr:hypothetical protein PACTADRAFT_52097 [Pachysolen tannophilus NRRL Y-2460]